MRDLILMVVSKSSNNRDPQPVTQSVDLASGASSLMAQTQSCLTLEAGLVLSLVLRCLGRTWTQMWSLTSTLDSGDLSSSVGRYFI